jgi:hypothetical protein
MKNTVLFEMSPLVLVYLEAGGRLFPKIVISEH